ncbi:MAG TPA: histidine kinase, partial [Bdellovibrionales bacterium]|nr:histidine kinase [Bdellovibrionales bacterium]
AEEVAAFNALLRKQKKPYVLIGVGRWGTLDPWLGIPVTWDQISGAVAIVEASFKDFEVAPSQGSHFFQNLTSFNIGYFTINAQTDGYINWEWLRTQEPQSQRRFTRHYRFEKPIKVLINGHKNRGVITLPGIDESE